jgi:hypothetical protein
MCPLLFCVCEITYIGTCAVQLNEFTVVVQVISRCIAAANQRMVN